MKESAIQFVKKVAFTTTLAFFLISFVYVGTFALLGRSMHGGLQSFFQFFSYMFGKLYLCIFPFSLCLGFLNRLMEKKSNRAVLRVVHFLLGFAAYFVFMDLLFNYLYLLEGETVAFRQIILHTLPYFVFYPITLWVTALGKAIFLPKEKKEFKSILD
jgi:hypothetical protein